MRNPKTRRVYKEKIVGFKMPEEHRTAFLGNKGNAQNGHFRVPIAGGHLIVIASNHAGWEHVSVSANKFNSSCIPSWNDMCLVKDLFWDDEDCVMQYHPPKSEYVNVCKYALHLWRPIGVEIPRPRSKHDVCDPPPSAVK